MKWPFGDRGSGGDGTAVSSPPRNSPEDEILRGCWNVESLIYQNSAILPTLGTALALRIIDEERRIIALATYLRGDVSHTLEATVKSYLPSLIQTYVRAAQSGVINETKFNEQVNIILESTLKVLDAVKSDNVNAMEAQSLFLDSKFGGSDLE